MGSGADYITEAAPARDLGGRAGRLGNHGHDHGQHLRDTRVAFGTRMDHAIVYDSPNGSGFSFDLVYALGLPAPVVSCAPPARRALWATLGR